MNGALLNPHVRSPRGFLASPRGSRPVRLAAGSVWGRHDVDRLRTAGWSVVTAPRTSPPTAPDRWGSPAGQRRAAQGGDVPERRDGPGAALPDDQLWALTVHALALAGVPTATAGLPGEVRDLIAPEILRAADAVDADSVSDRDQRERLSIQLRRAAWRAGPGRWFLRAAPTVLVLLPPAPSVSLLGDIAGQLGVTVRTARPEDPVALDGAGYVTRVDDRLRYSPHHLADLVHGLIHSRAAVVHSPDRFRRWGGGAWLEQEGVAERPAQEGLCGGSLWHAADGLDQPDGPGYAVHGANAVPGDAGSENRPGVLRWHTTRPALLDWLDEGRSLAGRPTPSYPARKLAGVPGRARTAETASES